MKIGTKSVLFGAHCWFIHPIFVFIAWWKLFGFPRDYRLWIAFFVHDLGYWNKPNMDGDEGERHVEWGANFMRRYDVSRYGLWWNDEHRPKDEVVYCWGVDSDMDLCEFWKNFALYHSRFYAKRDGAHFSPLCVADKLATCLEPWWLYLPRVILSGEIYEYMAHAGGTGKGGEFGKSKYDGDPILSKYLSMGISTRTKREWHSDMTEYMRKWAEEHKSMVHDTWTPEPKKSEVLNEQTS